LGRSVVTCFEGDRARKRFAQNLSVKCFSLRYHYWVKTGSISNGIKPPGPEGVCV
jgi:hypothetical protein